MTDISSEKQAAKFAGRLTYFTGMPCKHGHIAPRYVKRSLCVVCAKEKARRWAKNNPKRKAEIGRNSHRLVRYGLTENKYKELVANQLDCCAICYAECDSGHALSIDHDHSCCPTELSCGKCIRGLLCKSCNRLLGDAKEKISVLESAIRYLKAWQLETFL